MTYWNDNLIIGIAQIDNQHRKLVEAIDRLMEACSQGKGVTEIGQTLNVAADYSKEHFRDEENLQEKYAYPGINAHKRLHAQFVLNINALIQDFGRTGPNVALTGKLTKTLVDWLVNHICTEDIKVGEHIRKSGGC